MRWNLNIVLVPLLLTACAEVPSRHTGAASPRREQVTVIAMRGRTRQDKSAGTPQTPSPNLLTAVLQELSLYARPVSRAARSSTS